MKIRSVLVSASAAALCFGFASQVNAYADITAPTVNDVSIQAISEGYAEISFVAPVTPTGTNTYVLYQNGVAVPGQTAFLWMDNRPGHFIVSYVPGTNYAAGTWQIESSPMPAFSMTASLTDVPFFYGPFIPVSPADVLQQFSAVDCSVVPAFIAEQSPLGVASGGFGSSWAQWVNDGKGGPVCTRTLHYGSSGWQIAD